MSDTMTPAERALWKQAQDDYDHALKIASKAWADRGHAHDDTTVQAAAATVLIHVTKLRQDSPRAAAQPSTAPAAMTREVSPASQASAAVPPCPQCGGEMWDNRGKKKNPKGPDFKCKDKECKDDKGYGTGLWEKDLEKPAYKQAAKIRDRIDESFENVPKALQNDSDGLPF
jgi:hypothetical protein